MVSLAKTKHSKSEVAFAPVGVDPKTYVAKRSAKDPEFKHAYAALEDEFSALDALLTPATPPGCRRPRWQGAWVLTPHPWPVLKAAWVATNTLHHLQPCANTRKPGGCI